MRSSPAILIICGLVVGALLVPRDGPAQVRHGFSSYRSTPVRAAPTRSFPSQRQAVRPALRAGFRAPGTRGAARPGSSGRSRLASPQRVRTGFGRIVRSGPPAPSRRAAGRVQQRTDGGIVISRPVRGVTVIRRARVPRTSPSTGAERAASPEPRGDRPVRAFSRIVVERGPDRDRPGGMRDRRPAELTDPHLRPRHRVRPHPGRVNTIPAHVDRLRPRTRPRTRPGSVPTSRFRPAPGFGPLFRPFGPLFRPFGPLFRPFGRRTKVRFGDPRAFKHDLHHLHRVHDLEHLHHLHHIHHRFGHGIRFGLRHDFGFRLHFGFGHRFHDGVFGFRHRLQPIHFFGGVSPVVLFAPALFTAPVAADPTDRVGRTAAPREPGVPGATEPIVGCVAVEVRTDDGWHRVAVRPAALGASTVAGAARAIRRTLDAGEPLLLRVIDGTRLTLPAAAVREISVDDCGRP